MGLRGRCAVITSYNPQTKDSSLEDTGASTDTDKKFVYDLYTRLLEDVTPSPGMSKTETYEKQAKDRFKKEPASMKLLVVVDKLLTGFDAPSCTYLYIDKSMQDHGLFQAICRTNRLDGEDKEFGYIVDYKDLFKKVEKAIAVYSSDLADDDSGTDSQILLKDRLEAGRERLEHAREAIKLLCEGASPPRTELELIHYFCGNTEIATDLAEHEPQRVALYKATARLVRAFASIADELEGAGYSAHEAAAIKYEVGEHVKLREVIRKASGETIDLKAYEADMRHLIDTYIEADPVRVISMFDEMPLVELLVKSGIADAIASLPEGIRKRKDAVAETIANNVRSKIIKEHLRDPAYYDKMSALLDEIIADLKAKRLDYEAYLKKVADLAKKLFPAQAGGVPARLDTPGKRALYNNFGQDEELALRVDDAVRTNRPDAWRGVRAREQTVKQAIHQVVKDAALVERIFKLIEKHKDEY